MTFVPLAGAVLLMLLPRRDRDIRIFSLVVSLLTFVLSLHLPVHFHRGQTGFQYEINRAWISSPNIHYHMGIDGISMWLVVLTTFLTPLCVLISWKSVHDRVKEFFIILLILETALIGVFTSLDLFLFYFFWEATLIPMALLIGIFGHEPQGLCRGEIFHVHHDRVGVHAGGDSVALRAHRHVSISSLFAIRSRAAQCRTFRPRRSGSSLDSFWPLR